MDYIRKDLKWEDIFVSEAIELEKKLSNSSENLSKKSKLRIALESKILDWEKYSTWLAGNLGCASLKMNINNEDVAKILASASLTYKTYSQYNFWTEDLLPVFIWESQVYILGIQYDENLSQIKDHVLIITPPEILSALAKKVLIQSENLIELEEHRDENLDLNEQVEIDSNIDGIDLNIKPTELSFKDLSAEQNTQTVTNTATLEPDPAMLSKAQPDSSTFKPEENENTVWEFITERHEENSFEVKKQFNGYVVLRVHDNQTEVFKMDKELERKKINTAIFKYNLSEDNPFSRLLKLGSSECFNITQLGINLMDFKYACVTPLKRGGSVVGFLVGFKNVNLSEKDQSLLEDLAKESAA